MAIDEAEFDRRKRRADQARRARDKAAGLLEATMERLATEFGCNTMEKAEKLSAKLATDAAAAEQAYNKAATAFEEAWDDRLE